MPQTRRAAHSPGSANVAVNVSPAAKQLALAVRAPVVTTGDDPSWAVSLRSAFTGITYGNTYTLPDSIEHTGATGVSAAINSFIAGCPNGASPSNHTKIIFPSGYTYKLDGVNAINLSGRSNITLEGTGCTLLNRCTASSLFTYTWYFLNCDNIATRGFYVDGGNATTATLGPTAIESLSAAAIAGDCTYIEFDSVGWDYTYGFGPLICSNEAVSAWPENVWIHNCVIRGGEMGIGVTAGRKLLLEGNDILDSMYTPLDLEPDTSQLNGGGFQDVLFQDNYIDYWGWHDVSSNWFVAFVPQSGVVGTCTMDDLTVRRNHVEHGAANPANNGNYDGQGGLGVRGDSTNIKNRITFQDNTTNDDCTMLTGGGRAVMKLDYVHTLVITGNTQPISGTCPYVLNSGGANSTGVTISGNTN